MLLSLLLLLLLVSAFTLYLLFFSSRPSSRLITVALEEFQPLPVSKNSGHPPTPPRLTATAAYALDLDSMTVLYERNSQQQLYPASTAKMLTALVAAEELRGDEVLTVSTSAAQMSSSIPLRLSDRLSLANLLALLLIQSDNSAAYIIAENNQATSAAFLARMNQKAQELSLLNSHFVNPAGFDEEGTYSSARDLAILAKALLANEQLRQLVSQPSWTITLDNGQNYTLLNTNQLFAEVSGVSGVKTGTTDLAGEVLVSLIQRQGHRLLLVVMKSEDRYQDTKELLAWILNNYQWQNWSVQNKIAAPVPQF